MDTKWVGRFGFFSIVSLTTACASGPPPIQTQTTTLRGYGEAVEMTTQAALDQTTFYATSERVFAAVDEAYGRLEIPLTIRTAGAAARLGNAAYTTNRIEGQRMATYVDCGQDRNGRLANTHEITLMVVTALKSVADGGVEVSTILSAVGEPRAYSGNAIPCNSTGALEDRIAELVGAVLISDS
jgi:hypothetical protein